MFNRIKHCIELRDMTNKTAAKLAKYIRDDDSKIVDVNIKQ